MATSSKGERKVGKAIRVDAQADAPRYIAPAVEKGLDVIELLAQSPGAMSQKQIAEQLGRSVPEVYRVLASLERRGYIARGPEDAYRLTMKLHELAVAYPPIRRLTDLATPVMKRLALEAGQAFHLAVLDGAEIQVVLQIDSPAPLGLKVRLGGRNAVPRSASGRVLFAFQSDTTQRWILAQMREPPQNSKGRRTFLLRVASVRRAHYEFVAEESLLGLVDVSFPIVDSMGYALAALTMPFLTQQEQAVPLQGAARLAFAAAREISAGLGGAQPPAKFPLTDTGAQAMDETSD